MQAIMLDENQKSVVAESRESIQVRDQAGKVLGHIVPTTAGVNYRFDWERWLKSWDEWCFECEQPQLGAAECK